MPFTEEQYQKYIELAKQITSYKVFQTEARKRIFPDNPRVCSLHEKQGYPDPLESCEDCMQYHPDMITGTTSNLNRCGFVEIDSRSQIIGIPEHSERYLNGEISFSELVEESIFFALDPFKHRDADQLIVEAVLDILGALPKNYEEPITQADLVAKLSSDTNPINGYDFNIASEGSKRTQREILKLLENIGIVISSEGGCYKLGENKEVEKFKKNLRKISILDIAEDTIVDLGPNHDVLSTEFIMALSKYYIYRRTRGIGKQRPLISNIIDEMEKVHKALIKQYKIDGKKYGFSAGRGKILNSTAKRYRKKLARAIATICGITNYENNSTYKKMSSVSISSLKRLEDCKNLDDLKTSLKKVSGTRFDRTILDEIRHLDGSFKFSKDFKFFTESKTPWQKEAVQQWKKAEKGREEYSGIVSAVTGSGKTIMAMLAIEDYVSKNPNSIVSVIVPTKVLMYQWATELAKLLGLGSKDIGLRGDGFKDRFSNGKRVVVSIVNSAIKNSHLKKDVDELSLDIKHLLIADECHRYGGREFSNVFNVRIDAKLGLSATPPGENYQGDETDEKIGMGAIVHELGNICYRLTYKRAREDKLICEFTIKYVGVNLTPANKIVYDNLTKAIGKQLEKIRMRYGHRLDAMKADSLHQKLQTILNTDEQPDPSITKFFRLTKERRNIIYEAFERKSCYAHILKQALKPDGKATKTDKKIMIFHEKINQLEDVVSRDRRSVLNIEEISPELKKSIIKMESPINDELENMLKRNYYKPVMYHSKQDPKWNRWAIDWFKSDIANIMLSVKALVEGVDVPAADVGIVRVSSSSVRQRIQTIGRILRRGREKSAKIWVLFVKDTVDTQIFKAYDWEQELGMSSLEYWEWDESTKTLTKRNKEDLPVPEAFEDDRPPLEVDVSKLNPGDLYPGRYAGDMYHVSADGKPYKRSRYGRIFIKNQDIIKASQLIKEKKGGGKLLITPQGNMITRIKGQGTLFLGTTTKDDIRQEVHVQIEKIEKSKGKKRRFKKPPTFEELFGS